jgi:hypothetical protein
VNLQHRNAKILISTGSFVNGRTTPAVFVILMALATLAGCGGGDQVAQTVPMGQDFASERKEYAREVTQKPATVGPQTILYVSPSGNDAAPGTNPSQPLRTLERARDLVRTLNRDMAGDIVVYLRGGVHALPATVVFDARDSGSNGFSVKYANYPSEIPVLDGGQRIGGWTLHDAAKGIYKAPVNNLEFRQLYVNGTRAIRARSPNVDNYNTLTNWNNAGRTISVKRDEVAQWNNFSSVEIVVQTFFSDSRMRLASFTVDATTAYLKINPLEEKIAFVRDSPAGRPGQGYHFENAYEFIDQPGEWYLDRVTDMVYYKPRAGENMANAEAVVPRVDTLVKMQGTLDAPVRDVWMYGLVFQHTTWLRPNDFGHLATQAANPCLAAFGSDGGQFYAGRPPAALYVAGAEGVRLERNKVRGVGATGIDLHFGVHNSHVVGNEVYDTSANAINVGKYSDENVEIHTVYNPKDLREVNRANVVANNYVHEFGQDYAGAVGIGVGYTIATNIVSNEVANAPYSGISMGWGWRFDLNASRNNVIKFNRVHNVMGLLGDGGGIYFVGASRKSRVGWNWVHDLVRHPLATRFPVVGMYVDQGFDYSTIENNVFTNVGDRNIHKPLDKSMAYFNNDSQDQKIKDGSGLGAEYADIKLRNAATALDLRRGNTLRFTAVADTGVLQDAPGMANELTELAVRSKPNAVRRSFVRFQLAGLNGRSVKSVKLVLREAPTGSAGFASFDVKSAGSAWDETTINWGSQPIINATPLGKFSGQLAESQTIEVALNRTAVTGDDTYTFALQPTGNSDAAFASRELNGAPQLVVELDGGTTSPSPTPTQTSTPTPTPTPTQTQTQTQSPSSKLIFEAVEDARVDEVSSTGNIGTAPVIGVKYVISDSRYSYLRFNLSGLVGKTITGVTLQLRESTRSGEGDTHFAVRRVDGPWNESAVVWSNRPTPVGPVLGTFAAAKLTNGQLLNVPLTTSSFTGDGILNLGLIATGQTTNDSEFASRESGTPPKLIVEFK